MYAGNPGRVNSPGLSRLDRGGSIEGDRLRKIERVARRTGKGVSLFGDSFLPRGKVESKAVDISRASRSTRSRLAGNGDNSCRSCD